MHYAGVEEKMEIVLQFVLLIVGFIKNARTIGNYVA